MKTIQKQLTLDEVRDILLLSDKHTIESYLEKGWIPKISYNEKNMTIDAVMLARQLGVENFDEPFISEVATRGILGLPAKYDILRFCKKKGVNVYRLGNQMGVRYIFRESDLRKYTGVGLELLPFALEDKVRKNLASLIAGTFWVIIKLIDTERSARIFQRYIEGRTFEEIGQEFDLTRERVRQVYEKAKRRLVHRASKVQEWIHAFGPTKYADMEASDIVELLIKLGAENKLLKTRLSEVLSGQKLDEILPEVDIEKQKLLMTPIENLNLSVRAHNVLRALDIKTLGDIIDYSPADFLKFRNMGKKSLAEIKNLVRSKGFKLKK